MKASLVLFTMMLAGCFGTTHVEQPTAGLDHAALDPETLDISGTNCDALAMFLMVDPARVTPWLPAGYHPRDASALFDLPVASGKTPLMIAATLCPDPPFLPEGDNTTRWATGAIAIFVEAPGLDAVHFENKPAPLHFFAAQIYTDYEPWRDRLVPYESPVALVNMTFTLIDTWPMPTPHVVSTLTINGTSYDLSDPMALLDVLGPGPEMQFSITSPILLPEAAPNNVLTAWHIRFWNENHVGTTVIDYKFSNDVFVGHVFCSFREDSVAAQIAPDPLEARTHCQPSIEGGAPGGSIGASFQTLDTLGEFRSFPGEFAT